MSSSRRQYPFHLIEPKWQRHWEEQQSFRAWNPGESIPPTHPFARRHGTILPPKYYILDMFPYPSGAGLHVGHPEGYTATDILARYQRARGRNVLHPMGWDAFGLPAEQYAVKTGQHPRHTTEANITTFKRQIKSLGFSYDWTREVDTTDPKYFKWTQWIFLKLYNSWFNPETNKAEPMETLKYPEELKSERERRTFRDSRRLAYVSEAPVWWCEQLGTVLANEEVIDGKSEVGDFPVVRKPMRQWMLRITSYAGKLLADLDRIDWSHSLKEMQRNWIGRSEGAEVDFAIADGGLGMADCDRRIRVFTTRPDTLFGATYMVLSPEHKLVDSITTQEQREAVKEYQQFAAGKSDLERTELAKEKTGVFTGAYAINPVNREKIPIWIADYVLASYGTGAIMAVPGHDERDWEFAKKFSLPIREVIRIVRRDLNGNEVEGEALSLIVERLKDAPPGSAERHYVNLGDGREIEIQTVHHRALIDFDESAHCVNSDFLDGVPALEAKEKITAWLEAKGLGKKSTNYKLRDWLFSRQRYWGEPFPIVWKKDTTGTLYHEPLPESALPVLPPALDDYKPTPEGQPPLARAKDWVHLPDGSVRETNTMPQWAGSCWYYLRYLDAQNSGAFVSPTAEQYWMGAAHDSTITPHASLPTPGVDLYVGGTEHAVLHLLYARFWHKVLFDLGYVSTSEPFFKLVNQGLILGEDGQKMSKARGNVVNPDDMVNEFGADSLRLYEMFMGPLEMVKPWNTQGVKGVYHFLGRAWRLFVDEKSELEFEQAQTATEARTHGELLKLIKLNPAVRDVDPTREQLKVLHACIRKVTEDLDGMRFNTAISAMMVFVNQALPWETKPAGVLREFLILLQPFAPHLAEELWQKLSQAQNPQSKLAGDTSTSRIRDRTLDLPYQPWPQFDPELLVEETIEIPVQVNGKLRDVMRVSATATQAELESAAFASEKVKPFLEGKTVKKTIIVPKKLVNIVVT